eukprot:556411-Heterocapsa_arctica.AAC.1
MAYPETDKPPLTYYKLCLQAQVPCVIYRYTDKFAVTTLAPSPAQAQRADRASIAFGKPSCPKLSTQVAQQPWLPIATTQ